MLFRVLFLLGKDLIIAYIKGFIVVNNILSEIDSNKISASYYKL